MRNSRLQEERMRRFYNSLWQRYIPEYTASERHWAFFFQPQEVEGKSVLDAGCGTGIFSLIFARKGASSVIGIDISERSLEMAQKWANQFELQNTLFQQANMNQLPFPDASFDIVWAWGTIHHTADPFGSLAELTRVLKPGGLLLLAVYRKTGLSFLHEIMRMSLTRLPRKSWIPLSRILSLILTPLVYLIKNNNWVHTL